MYNDPTPLYMVCHQYVWSVVSMFGLSPVCIVSSVWSVFSMYGLLTVANTVELQWLEHLWNYENIFETGVVRAKVLIIALGQEA